MNKQIEGLDKNGVRRVYGIGKTRQQAIVACLDAAKDYLKERPDIDALYLADDAGKPVFDAATYSQWKVSA